MKPEGASFDDLGRGVEEGASNVRSVSETAATRSLEMLKQVSSTGYLRKRLPQDLMDWNGGIDPEIALRTLVPETNAETAQTVAVAVPMTMDARTKAKM